MRSRLGFGAVAVAIAGLAIASPAFAHIDPDPTDAQAGSEVVVGFTVQHGCEGSPTVRLDMRLPTGVGGPTAEPPAGWTGRVVDNIVTFEGGPLPDDEALTFRVRMILPQTPDTTIYFPFVQRCEVGDIRWIEIPSDGGGDELDEPAPAMRLFGPAAVRQPAAPTPPSATIPGSSTSSTTPAVVTTATSPSPAPPATPSAVARIEPTSRPAPGANDAEGSSGTVAVVVSIGAVAVVAAGAFAALRRVRR